MRVSRYGLAAFSVSLVLLCSLASAQAEELGKLYVVGMGPAGPDLTAPRVLSIVEKADFLLCSPGMPERFSRFGSRIDPNVA